MPNEKTQREDWSKEDERYFFERYESTEKKNPDILVKWAFNLYAARDFSLHDKVLSYLEKYFSDFPDDTEHRAVALYLAARVHHDRGEFDKPVLRKTRLEIILQREICRQAVIQHQPVPVPVFRNVRHSGVSALTDAFFRDVGSF